MVLYGSIVSFECLMVLYSIRYTQKKLQHYW